MNNFDPIFALSVPSGRGAIHLHRLSGENIAKLLTPFIRSISTKSPVNLITLFQNTNEKIISRYVYIVDIEDNVIDDTIISLFSTPHSYTGEDVIEISTHGNPLISAKLHSLLRSIGMRDAKPGEFTQRAVLNGKIDLAQAEGINTLIHIETLGGLTLARNSVDGILSKESQNIRVQLISILSYLEAHIDFAPDEVGTYEPNFLLPEIKIVTDRLSSLQKSYSSGLKMREGLRVVLVGKPNAGKSSLYNSLLRYDRAIVTNIPGTTRDTLEDKLLIENKDFILLDTAGIRETQDVVEQMGVQRSYQSITKADIICLILDIEHVLFEDIKSYIEAETLEFLNSANIQTEQELLIVISKKDILSQDKVKFINSLENIIFVSNQNTSHLCTKLVNFHNTLTENARHKDAPILISERQKDKVDLALKFLNEASDLIINEDYPEKIASVLIQSVRSIEEIVGEIHTDNILEKVFSSFCIGK